MSAYSFIYPALTAVSFLLFIIAAQRAWLPKSGTTEWIRRSAFPPVMSADGLAPLHWFHLLSALGIAVIYGAVVSVCFSGLSGFTPQTFARAGCAGVFIGGVFLTGCTLLSGFGAGVLAAAASAADIWLLNTAVSCDISMCVGLALASLYVLSVCIAIRRPWLLIFSGLLLGGAVYFNPAFAVLVVFGVCAAFSAGAVSGKKRLFWMLPVFSVVLPGAVLCLADFFVHGGIAVPMLAVKLPEGVFDPVYLVCAVICLVITFIHIFRDKSLSALIIFFCGVCSAGCAVFGIPGAALFAGLAFAYSGNIIISRGTACQKAMAVIFTVILCLGLVICAGLSLSVYNQSVHEIFSRLSGCWIHLN